MERGRTGGDSSFVIFIIMINPDGEDAILALAVRVNYNIVEFDYSSAVVEV